MIDQMKGKTYQETDSESNRQTVRIAERQEDSPRLMKDLHLALKDHLQREGKPVRALQASRN